MRTNNGFVESVDGTSGYETGAFTEDFIDIDIYGPESGDMDNLSKVTEVDSSNGFSLTPDLAKGIGRLIGCGVEVHNVTPELYRSGTITCGSMPQSNQEYTFNYVNASNVPVIVSGTPSGTTYSRSYYTTNASVRPLYNRPATIAEAMTYPGTTQWDAKDGLYMILCQQGLLNDPAPPEYIYPLFLNQEIDDVPMQAINDSAIGIVPTQTGSHATLAHVMPGPVKWAPVSTKFAYFTGLSPETKLTVNCRIFYETFPTILQQDILTLSTPSPDLDEHALQLYQHCQTHLPCGVPVGMNGLGEWFAMAVSEFSDVAGLGLSAIGVPFGQQIASSAKVLADRYIKAQAHKAESAGKTTVSTIANNQRKKKKRKQPGVTAPSMVKK